MRKFQHYVGLALILIALVTLSGCSLPEVVFKTAAPQTTTATVTVTVPATTTTVTPDVTTAVSPPTSTPALSSTTTAINPGYTPPTISTSGSGVNQFPVLADIISSVRPSVVAINTTTTGRSIFGGTFNQRGAGSGWIIDSTGLVVTNNHVVEGATKVAVTLEDGRDFPAKTIRTDSVSDLAVLKIEASNLPALKIGDSSQIRVGDWVIAIGNSLGEGISATKGIISAKGVSVSADNGETLYDLIQTDAAINPGNSGGPLVNLSGQVIGINSIKVAQVGVEGMGYAISTQTAIPIINELITKGYVTRPWLGVKLYSVDDYAINQLNLKVDKGVLITEVVSGGPAAKSGFKKFDVITMVDGKAVSTTQELVKIIREHKAGDIIKITFYRDDQKSTASLTLEQAPPPS